ncbi:hypothetical protein [Agrobacterium sp. CG674]
MNHALEMMSNLERHVNRPLEGHSVTWFAGICTSTDYSFHWNLGAHRLADAVYDHVLTLQHLRLNDEIQRQGVLTEFIERILTRDPAPRIPLTHLHFKGCNEVIIPLLQRLHFHSYRIGDRQDYWMKVTGQKELL